MMQARKKKEEESNKLIIQQTAPAEITESENDDQELPSDKSIHSSNEGDQFDPNAEIEEMISVEVSSEENPLGDDDRDYVSQNIDYRDQLNEHSQMAYDQLTEDEEFQSLNSEEIEIVSDDGEEGNNYGSE